MKKIIALFFMIISYPFVCFSDITWSSPPTTISNAGVNASDPRIVMDGSGNATAAWVENGVIKSSSKPVAGSWGAINTLSGASGASLPKLGVDSSGNVTALWLENGVVNSATLPFGGSWSAATAISASGASEPRLAVDGSGNAVAIWTRNGFIESSTKLFGGSWSIVNMLSSGGAESSPSVAIGANGTVVAVWHQNTGSHIIVSAKKTISGSWGSPLNLFGATAAFIHNYPIVAVDNNGNATALWYRYNQSGSAFTNVIVLASTLTSAGTSWSIPNQINQGGGLRNPAGFITRIGYDSNGDALALWGNSYDGFSYAIETATISPGGTWSVGGNLVLQNLYAYQGDFAIIPFGDVVSAYMFYDGSSILIQSNETTLGGLLPNSWSIPLNLSQGANNAFPRVASTLSGTTINAVAVWVNNNGLNNEIQTTTGSRTVLLPPTNVSAVQNANNFGVFTEFYNTVSWTASTDPNVAGYVIYRNGTVIFEVGAGTTQFIDHNAAQAGTTTGTYGVAARDSQFVQSQTVTTSIP